MSFIYFLCILVAINIITGIISWKLGLIPDKNKTRLVYAIIMIIAGFIYLPYMLIQKKRTKIKVFKSIDLSENHKILKNFHKPGMVQPVIVKCPFCLYEMEMEIYNKKLLGEMTCPSCKTNLREKYADDPSQLSIKYDEYKTIIPNFKRKILECPYCQSEILVDIMNEEIRIPHLCSNCKKTLHKANIDSYNIYS